MTPLYESYRPKSFTDVVGQPKVIKQLATIRKTYGTLSGQAYWLSGQSGTGKTTIARLIAAEIADDWMIDEIDATTLTVKGIVEMERGWVLRGMGKGGRAFIINEAHGLRKDVIRQLLTSLERQPGHVVIVFTTTCDGQKALFDDYDDAAPLLSRCVRLDMARRGLAEAFAERARMIARAEGIDVKPFVEYVLLAKLHRNNFRAMLQAIAGGAMAD